MPLVFLKTCGWYCQLSGYFILILLYFSYLISLNRNIISKRGTCVDWCTNLVYISSVCAKKNNDFKFKILPVKHFCLPAILPLNNYLGITNLCPVKGSRLTVWQIQGVSKSVGSMLLAVHKNEAQRGNWWWRKWQF